MGAAWLGMSWANNLVKLGDGLCRLVYVSEEGVLMFLDSGGKRIDCFICGRRAYLYTLLIVNDKLYLEWPLLPRSS